MEIFKPILGIFLSLHIMPIGGIILALTVTNENMSIKEGYILGWILNFLFLLVIGFCFLIIWCFN